MRLPMIVVVAWLATSACSGAGSTSLEPGAGGVDRTGLEGTIYLGPIQPVCQVEEPCNAPMVGDFSLQRAGRLVVRFSSDSAGRYQVYAGPGTYLVVPKQPVGIASQTPEVNVGSAGLTHTDITFDTGIR